MPVGHSRNAYLTTTIPSTGRQRFLLDRDPCNRTRLLRPAPVPTSFADSAIQCPKRSDDGRSLAFSLRDPVDAPNRLLHTSGVVTRPLNRKGASWGHLRAQEALQTVSWDGQTEAA